MSSSFSLQHIHEPLLEFAGGARHPDMRFGLIEYGPVDFSTDRTRTVSLGIVGSSRTVEGLRTWLIRCEQEIPAKKSEQPNLFPSFPGCGIGGPFRCWFEVDGRNERVVTTARLNRITSEENDETAVRLAVEIFADEVRSLAESEHPPQAILCALPVEVIERIKNMRRDPDAAAATDEEIKEEEDENTGKDFRGALKAATMAYRVPIQIVWPSTFDNTAVVRRKLAKLSDRTVQDEATRAWNLFGALYYKSGGTPWRMVRDQRDFPALFIGISFYEELAREALQSSSAQLFDERGEGLILKGGTALRDKTNRQPYLSSEDAHALLRGALATYKREWGNYPARLVIHKSSRFHRAEMEGLEKAIDDVGIDTADFIWLPRKSMVKLVRPGVYPPLRGTALRLDDNASILYTRGSVDFFRTYPGKYVPNPLMMRAQRLDTPSWDTVLCETLALTKMNWNNTQFDGGLPITMRAARQVGEILKHVPVGTLPDPRYRFYM